MGVVQNRKVELKTRRDTPDAGALQRSADFVTAYLLGFAIPDAIALLRMEDLYVESFEIKVRRGLGIAHWKTLALL